MGGETTKVSVIWRRYSSIVPISSLSLDTMGMAFSASGWLWLWLFVVVVVVVWMGCCWFMTPFRSLFRSTFWWFGWSFSPISSLAFCSFSPCSFWFLAIFEPTKRSSPPPAKREISTSLFTQWMILWGSRLDYETTRNKELLHSPKDTHCHHSKIKEGLFYK